MNKKELITKRRAHSGGINKEHRLSGKKAYIKKVNRDKARERFSASRTGKLLAQQEAEEYKIYREQVLESYRARAVAAVTPEARRHLCQEVWRKRQEWPDALRIVQQTLGEQAANSTQCENE